MTESGLQNIDQPIYAKLLSSEKQSKFQLQQLQSLKLMFDRLIQLIEIMSNQQKLDPTLDNQFLQ
jgi:hypothetical protein